MNISIQSPSYNIANTTTQSHNTENLNNTADFAKDKSQAVRELMDYGVDSEGYFTNDLNQAAGIPKDYRIKVGRFENLVQSTNTEDGLFMLYTKIDIAKTISNIYQEISNISNNQDSPIKNADTDRVLSNTELSAGDKIEALFFANSFQLSANTFIEGQTTMLGKIFGVDKNISKSEMQEFFNFMSGKGMISPFSVGGTPTDSSWNVFSDISNLAMSGFIMSEKDSSLAAVAKSIHRDYYELLQSDMSLDEFKVEYTKLKERYDNDFLKVVYEKGYDKEMKNSNDSNSSIEESTQVTQNARDSKDKPFTPIQGESKNKETYKDTYSSILFFESQLKLEQIQILLKQNTRDSLGLKGIQALLDFSQRGFNKEA